MVERLANHRLGAMTAQRSPSFDGQSLGLFATLRGKRAACPKIAPRLGVDEIRQLAPDGDQSLGRIGTDARQCGEEPARIGMARFGQHRPGRARLDHAPGVEHRDALANAVDDAEIMAHQQHRETAPRTQIFQKIEDLRLDGDIEGRRGFIEQQQFRLGCERGRDHHALLHAARELMRISVHDLRRTRHAHIGEERRRTCEGFVAREAEMQHHRLGDLKADGERRVERGARILEHRADPLSPELRGPLARDRDLKIPPARP